LPPERLLAEQFKAGRPAIREAIKALTILDVLESRRGDGTYVKSLAALHSGWPAVVEVSEENFDMLELLEVRKIIEPKAAKLAATRASEHDLVEIARLQAALEAEPIDWRKVGDLDYRLHAAIIRAAGNSILSSLHKHLAPLLLRSREITARTAQDWRRMRDDHTGIVRAILRGEGDAAEQAMLEHMHDIGLDLISNRKR
jgi:GntR family transcriptional repressor for pyruvate dehydrogenase complex